MPIASFDQLYQAADAMPESVGVAVAGGADPTVLEALRSACDRGWVTPHVVGTAAEVCKTAEAIGVDLHGFNLIDAVTPGPAAVALVRSGQADLLMKGQIATPTLMKAVLDSASGLRTNRVVCQVVLMEIAGRRFLLADTGICIQPTLEQKIDIMASAVTMAHALGAECPGVAVMAATESLARAKKLALESAIPAGLPRGMADARRLTQVLLNLVRPVNGRAAGCAGRFRSTWPMIPLPPPRSWPTPLSEGTTSCSFPICCQRT